MPKVNLSKLSNPPPDPLNVLICGTITAKQIKPSEICAVLGWSSRKYYQRRKNPASWKYSEIISICRFLDIPVDELRTAVRYR